ncbi:MAG: prolyl oligopeptidase family serine peptidase [Chloroflexota bacterium]|nr:prolyl oligopeptidase family serine peptidase [Chloroflexota bacterium]MDE2947816.1 prolyl oligopeptidase family serine peptidase [Chloroflexota bacterium]
MLGKLNYPVTRRVDVADDFFGTLVADPYRWLEEADDPEVLEWTRQQHELAMEALNGLPGRAAFEGRLREVWGYPQHGIPRKRGDKLFYMRNDGLQAQPVLYVQEGDKPERALIDPNTFSEDGAVAIFDWQPTGDGRLVMYALSDGGLDWVHFRFRDVESGEDLADKLARLKFSSVAWRKDGSGFFYSRYTDGAPDEGPENPTVSYQVYYHKLGTQQADDKLIYADPRRKGIQLAAAVSSDDRFLILDITWESRIANRLYYRPIDDEGDFVRLFDELDAEYRFIGNDGDIFYILTTNGALNWRVVAVDIKNPASDNWVDVVPESEEAIAGVSIVNQQFVVTAMRLSRHVIKIYRKDGSLDRELLPPGMGAVAEREQAGAFGGAKDDKMFIAWTSFLQPTQILQYDFATGDLAPFFSATAPSFDPEQYETRQAFCPSQDGAKVPIFITCKRGLELNGDNPAIMYAYGGYSFSQTPSYREWLPVWLENGGIFVVANIRGGGEYGEAWHRAGMFAGRQRTYDDIHAAAEWLIENRYTSNRRLAIEGRSNGGLLVAVCMLQRPDLYGAILCHVPTIDMLRFKYFTSGRYWTTEYGDAEKSKEAFEYLTAYGPLHNIKAGQAYPPILILTADHDDRVVPMHSKKLAAALQQADESDNVILLRVTTRAGHALGKATYKLIEEQVDIFAFLNHVFDMGVE